MKSNILTQKNKIFFILTSMFLLLLSINTVFALNDSTLISWWNFEQTSGNLLDQKGSYNGVGSGVIRNQTGKVGQAWDLNATTSDINFGLIDPIGTGNRTVCAWTYAKSTGGAGFGRIMANGQFIFQVTSPSKLTITNNAASYDSGMADNSLALNLWQFVCATRTSTGTVNYYQNGVANGTANQIATGTPTAGTTNFHIGNQQTLTRDWNGLLDEVSIWSSILTQSDINFLYNNGYGRTYPLPPEPEPDQNHVYSLIDGSAPVGIQWDANSSYIGNRRNTVAPADQTRIDILSQHYNVLTMDVPAKFVWTQYTGNPSLDFNWDSYDAICNYAYTKGMVCSLQMIIDGTGYWTAPYSTMLDVNFDFTFVNYDDNYPNTPHFTANTNLISMWDDDYNTINFYANSAMANHYAGNPKVKIYISPPNEGFQYRLIPESSIDQNTKWWAYLNTVYKDPYWLNIAYGGTTYTDFNQVGIPFTRSYPVRQQYDWWQMKTERASLLMKESSRALKVPDNTKIVTSIKILNEDVYPDTGTNTYGYKRNLDLNYYTSLAKPYLDFVNCDIYSSATSPSKQAYIYDMRLSFCSALGRNIERPVYLGEFYNSVTCYAYNPVTCTDPQPASESSHDANMNAQMVTQTLAYVGADRNSGVRGLSVFTDKGGYNDKRDIYNTPTGDLFFKLTPLIKDTLKNKNNTVTSNLALCDNTNINIAYNYDYWLYEPIWGFLQLYRTNDKLPIKMYLNNKCKTATEPLMYANQINLWNSEVIDLNTWVNAGGTLITGFRFGEGDETKRSDYGGTNLRSANVNSLLGITASIIHDNNRFDVNVASTKTILTQATGTKIFDLSSSIGDLEEITNGSATSEALFYDSDYDGKPAIIRKTIGSGKSIHFGFNLYEVFTGSNAASTNLNVAYRDLLQSSGITLPAAYPNYFVWQIPNYTGINTIGTTSGTYTFQSYSDINYIDGNAITNSQGASYTMGVGTGKSIIALSNATAPPTTTISGNNYATWTNTNQDITFTCTPNSAPCAFTTYKLDGGADTNATTFTISTDGNHTITYWSTDTNGNTESHNTSYAAVDKTAPTSGTITLSGFTVYSNYIKGNGSLTLDVNASISGISDCMYSMDDGASWQGATNDTNHCYKTPITILDGVDYTFKFRVHDNANNVSYSTSSITYIPDFTAPITSGAITSGTLGTNGWYTTNVGYTITATDSQSGVKFTQYCTDTTNTCTPTTTYTTPITLSTNSATNYVRFFSGDNLDNNNSIQSSGAIKIDKTAPSMGSVSITGQTIYTTYIKGNVTFYALVVESLSGVNYCQYTIDDGTNWYSADYIGSFCTKTLTITNGTSYKFGLRAIDNAGNNATKTTFAGTYIGDTETPTTTLAYNQPLIYTRIDVNLTCVDPLSGCATTKYRIDNNVWITYTVPFTVQKSGTVIIDYNSTDNIGNQETMKTQSIYIKPDVVAPTLAYAIPKTYGFGVDNNIPYTLTCSGDKNDQLYFDVNVNGINVLHRIDNNGATDSNWITITSGSPTFIFTCTNQSGLTTTTTVNPFQIYQYLLVNEITGVLLDTNTIDNNFAIARVYSIDGLYSYDFKANHRGDINAILPTAQLVFNFGYNNTELTQINRVINGSIEIKTPMRICTPTYQSFYEQRFVSYTPRSITLYNNTADCYEVQAVLNYLSSNNYGITTYTTNRPFYLYTWDSGVKTFFSYIDGSVAQSYNLDVILLTRQTIVYQQIVDGLYAAPLVNPLTNQTDLNMLSISYRSGDSNNTSASLVIYLGNTVVYNQAFNDSNTANAFNLNWDYSGLAGVTNSSFFRIVVTAQNPNGQKITTRTINNAGVAPPININIGGTNFYGKLAPFLPIFALILSALFFIFGLTIASTGRTFGMFGILMCLGAIAIASIAIETWYIDIAIAFYVVTILFIMLVGKPKDNIMG